MPDKALPDPSGSLQRFKVRKEKIILGLRPVGSSLAPHKGFSTGPFGGAVDQEPSASRGHQGASSLPAPAQIPRGNVSHAKESIFLAQQAFLNTPAHVPFMHVINRALKMMHHLLFQKTGRTQKSCCKSWYLLQLQAQGIKPRFSVPLTGEVSTSIPWRAPHEESYPKYKSLTFSTPSRGVSSSCTHLNTLYITYNQFPWF